MKCYLLAVATLVAVCVGCRSGVYDASNTLEGPAGPGPAVAGPGGSDIQLANYHRNPNGHRPAGAHYFAPPAEQLVRPGPMVDGPGPGVLNMMGGVGGPGMGGMGGPGCPPGPFMGPGGGGYGRSFETTTTQVRFVGPEGTVIGWQIGGGFATNQLVAPAKYDFQQGATYRLTLSNLPNREALTLYPTLQVYPTHPETDAYLAHNGVPVQITDEDLDQVEANNFLTKVIYLPSPKHQELAIAGVETLVSTRLDPGIDPVHEADRRGTILAVLRLGNKDLGTAPEAAKLVTEAGMTEIRLVDGEKGEQVAPMPIGGSPQNVHAVPHPMMMGAANGFGTPAMSPLGLGASPSWGMPQTGTPIGLVGPTHLPYGAPAGLKSHTVRNRSRQQIPPPVDHMLIDVKQTPGIRMPPPVKYIHYQENHPVVD